MYHMPYALFLACCSMCSPMFLVLFLDLTFPYYFQSLSIPPGFQHFSLQRFFPFYFGYSPIELWDSLSVMHTLGKLVWLSRPLIGQVHSGLACLVIHPGMTLVKLIMTGHCCDCLVGELNCLVSTHWLIAQPRLCSSTLLQWL